MRVGPIFFERPLARFLRDPVTVRGAVLAIVSATFVIVVGSGPLMTLLDHREYPGLGRGMWWALQTVTTVGYGDVTPRAFKGRIVAAVVMFTGIALLAIVTAAVTSSFVQRAQAAERAEEAQEHAEEDARLDDIAARLERVEALLRAADEALRAGSARLREAQRVPERGARSRRRDDDVPAPLAGNLQVHRAARGVRRGRGLQLRLRAIDRPERATTGTRKACSAPAPVIVTTDLPFVAIG